MTSPVLRLVLPVCDEGDRFAIYVAALVDEALRRPELPVELVVVDDGSGPEARALQAKAAAAAAARLAGSPHRLSVVTLAANRGKGAAVREGFGEARGAAWVGFVDGDGSVPAREVFRVAASLPLAECDVLVGARLPESGRPVRRSWFRRLQGRVFAALVRRVFRLPLSDVQCGFKLVRASALLPCLDALQERRWLLDVELVTLLQAGGARLAEEAIEWADSGGSLIVFGVDAALMLVGLARILWRTRRRAAALPAGGGAAGDP